jgi:hypothetical protein
MVMSVFRTILGKIMRIVRRPSWQSVKAANERADRAELALALATERGDRLSAMLAGSRSYEAVLQERNRRIRAERRLDETCIELKQAREGMARTCKALGEAGRLLYNG